MTDVEQVPPARDLSAERKAAVRDLLVTEVGRSRPWWRRSRRFALTSLIGGTAVVLAGGAAAAYVAFKPATDKFSVVCYSAPRLDDVATARLALAAPHDDSEGTSAPAETISDPVAACSRLWAAGILRSGATTLKGPGDGSPVPAMATCTLDDHTAAVFPGDPDTCARLGLPQTGPAPN